MPTTALTPGAEEVAGRIAGAVLAALRAEAGRTQEQLAEQLRVGVSTVQAWESGRRSLVRASFQDLQRLNRQLRINGTAPALLHVLDQALLVDAIYSDMANDGDAPHPLALVVPDRTLTELLAWPLSGAPPRQLRSSRAARLHVSPGVRDSVASSLRAAADRSAPDERGAMMRRQVKFLVAENGPSQDWLRQYAALDVRAQTDLGSWSPQWAVARSQAVSSAHAGDLDPLRRFIHHGLSDDAGIEANLSYWAYWVGEHTALWTEDADMTRPAPDWTGDRLLASLIDGVVHAPYRELCVHALWSLLRSRRHLIRDRRTARRVLDAAETSLACDSLDGDARRRLEQVQYLAESAG